MVTKSTNGSSKHVSNREDIRFIWLPPHMITKDCSSFCPFFWYCILQFVETEIYCSVFTKPIMVVLWVTSLISKLKSKNPAKSFLLVKKHRSWVPNALLILNCVFLQFSSSKY